LQHTQNLPPPKIARLMAWLKSRPLETVRGWLM